MNPLTRSNPATPAVVADYGDLCGEGPVWDPAASRLYWTDNTGNRFYCLDWATGQHRILLEGFQVNGAAVNEAGGFLLINNSGIWQWDGVDAPRLIAVEAAGAKCQLNDCTADPAGRLYAGSVFFDASGNYALGKLFRLDPDRTVHIVDEGFHIANGMAFSPDERTFYFADSGTRIIYAYDYDRTSGELRNRRVLVQVPRDEGLPDGLTVDAEGYLWSAQWYGSSVVRYDPEGKVERRVAVPAKQTSSVAFGVPDLTDIFVTSAKHFEASPIMPPGYDPHSGNIGGQLYHFNLGIPGKPEFKTRFQL